MILLVRDLLDSTRVTCTLFKNLSPDEAERVSSLWRG